MLSSAFDDDSNQPLFVFSGQQLLTVHYDVMDIDFEEAAERSAIDERRGLVIAQAVHLEDLMGEFILYLEDREDQAAAQAKLDRMKVHQKIERLRTVLAPLPVGAGAVVDRVRDVMERRNLLAHSHLETNPSGFITWRSDPDLHWMLVDRRRHVIEEVSMARLREDVGTVQTVFAELIGLAERMVEVAPHPRHFPGGWYIDLPTP